MIERNILSMFKLGRMAIWDVVKEKLIINYKENKLSTRFDMYVCA